jgi:hypothetical protein
MANNDYRTRISDMPEEKRQAVAPGAQAYSDFPAGKFNSADMLKDSGKFIAEATPILGDAIAAKEVYDELQKEDPNYFLVGALGGAAVVGLIPGVGDAAAKMIREGAEKGLDFANKAYQAAPPVVGDVVGQTKAMLSGDKDFITESPVPARGVGADVTSDELDAIDELTTKSTNALPKSKINPLFKNESTNPDTLITFYSPLLSAVDNMQFGKKGKTGEQIMAYLNKRAPNVSKAELKFSGLNLDPKKRYTKQDLNEKMGNAAVGVQAKVISEQDSEFSGVQIPRNLMDDPEEYFEIVLDAPTVKKDLRTHHDVTTLAHSRADIRKSPTGERYLLIHELQSDALQNAGKLIDDTGIEHPSEILNSFRIDFEYDLGSSTMGRETDKVFRIMEADYSDPVSVSDLKKKYKDELGIEVYGRDREVVHKDALSKVFPDVEYSRELEPHIGQLFLDLSDSSESLQKAKAVYETKDIPISSNTEYVKNLIIANAAKAKESGINTVVIPSIDELARLRAQDFDGGIEAAKKALKPTYVDAVRKAVNVINNEYKGAIKVGRQNLGYADLTQDSGFRVSPGTALDISGFDFDPQKQAVRFAEGGAVGNMERQMELFEEGGIADDGMERDPVSGNEVPPGSLASEVRDDIPAQLSEGEYVVPADVVRFFGVRFFEDLRNQAKSGLMEMEANGRIGGEPVMESGTVSDEEFEAALAKVGLAKGGVMGYDEGGDVTSNQTLARYPNYNLPGVSAFTSTNSYTMPGSSVFPNYTPPVVPEATPDQPMTGDVTLYGPGGEIVNLVLPGDQQRYDALIGQGYTLEPQVQPEDVPELQQSGGGDDDGGPGVTPTTTSEDYSETEQYQQLLEDPLAYGRNLLKKKDLSKSVAGVAGLLGGPTANLIGGVLGAGLTANNVAQAKAASLIAQKLGYDTTEYDKEVDEYVKSLPNASEFASSMVEGTSYADKFFAAALAPDQGGGLTLEDFQTEEAFETVMEDVAPTGMSYDPDSGSYIRDDDDEDIGEQLGGTRIGTGGGGTPVYSPGSGTTRPVLRPDDSDSDSTSTSSSGGGSNTFLQDVANFLTPNDGQRYVGGQLVDEDDDD